MTRFLRIHSSMALAVVVLTVILAGYIVFTLNRLLPQWQVRQQLVERQGQLQQAAQRSDDNTQPVPTVADPQLAEQFQQGIARLLNETQAADLLNNVQQAAVLTDVSVQDVQAMPMSTTAQAAAYDVRTFHIEVTGSGANLQSFLVQLRETALSGVVIDQLLLQSTQPTATLSLQITLYTSPLAPVAPLANEPALLSTPTAVFNPTADFAALNEQLHDPWAAEDWPTVIQLLNEMRAIFPQDSETMAKLYAAHVNYGYALADLGETAAATHQFTLAAEINPNGIEAQEGLQSVDDNSTTDRYQVQPGDTLFSIAQRFQTTVAALQAANDLQSNSISPGQWLIIPNE